eukprot:409728_1
MIYILNNFVWFYWFLFAFLLSLLCYKPCPIHAFYPDKLQLTARIMCANTYRQIPSIYSSPVSVRRDVVRGWPVYRTVLYVHAQPSSGIRNNILRVHTNQ